MEDLVQGDPKKTEPNSNYSKYTGSVFFGSPCTMVSDTEFFKKDLKSVFSESSNARVYAF